MIMLTRRVLLGTAAASLAAPAIVHAQGTPPIRIGEINSYTINPVHTVAVRNGWMMAVDEVNAAGGVLGRKLEVISRDDGGQPQNATRFAAELVSDQKVDLIAGAYLSNIGLALADYAKQANILYAAGEPLTDALTLDKGTATCYRMWTSTYMQVAAIVDTAASLKAKSWATLAPNYEFGQSSVRLFKQLLSAKRPDVTFVEEQWPALGRLVAGATVQALGDAKPDAIFNATFGSDLVSFIREGNTRGLFDGRDVVSLLTGEPEYMDPLGDETPDGWYVTGYPVAQITDPAGVKFRNDYQGRFKLLPNMGSVMGYALINAIAAGIAKTGSTETAKMLTGFGGAAFDTPFGKSYFRAIDHQGTLGTYVGRIKLQDGKGVMTDWHYVDGATVLPPAEMVSKLRPQT